MKKLENVDFKPRQVDIFFVLRLRATKIYLMYI